MENIQHIFEKTECLSTEQLQAYAGNELTGTENHKVEKHLGQCPMCTDVLEGLEEMQNTETLAFHVHAVNKAIDARITPPKKPLHLRIKPILSIAAAVIFLLGLSYIIKISVFDLKNETATAEYVHNVESSPNSETLYNSSAEIQEETSPIVKKEIISEKALPTGDTEPIDNIELLKEKETVETSAKEPEHLSGNLAEEELSEEESPALSSAANEDKQADESEEASVPVFSGRAVKRDDTGNSENLTEKAKTNKTARNEKSIFSGNTRSEVNRKEKKSNISAESPSADISLADETADSVPDKDYEQAVELFNDKSYGKALQALNKIIRADSLHKYDALWYKALIYKAKGKQEDANKMFGKVAKSKTVFSRKAAEELNNN